MEYIKHVFFDLDHTLWDYEKNARHTCSQLLINYQHHLDTKIELDSFYNKFTVHNLRLWKLFRETDVSIEETRRERTISTFNDFGIEEQDWMSLFTADFLSICPTMGFLIEGAEELLAFLRPKFGLHIISNGFSEAQKIKISHSNLNGYFDSITCWDDSGHKKPAPQIFSHAIKGLNVRADQCLYIGDNYEVDVKGGVASGMEVIYFANHQSHTNPFRVFVANKLPEVKGFFR